MVDLLEGSERDYEKMERKINLAFARNVHHCGHRFGTTFEINYFQIHNFNFRFLERRKDRTTRKKIS